MAANSATLSDVPSGRPVHREQALDIARGLAVVSMIYIHLVPEETRETGFAALLSAITRAMQGKAAALFCILAGMAWAMQAQRRSDLGRYGVYIARRSAALAAAGVLLHLKIWSTEILLPLALMLPICALCHRGGRRVIGAALLLTLVAAPATFALFGRFAETDWIDGSTHIADTSLGWQTVRYLLFDGNYPLIPWLAYPLFGMLLVSRDRHVSARCRGWFLLALPTAIASSLYASRAASHGEGMGTLAGCLKVSWTPMTTLPFLLVNGSAALTLLAGLLWLDGARKTPSFIRPLAYLGRTSLTHYVLHILAVSLPLSAHFPNDDWPVSIGFLCTSIYLVCALLLSRVWLRRSPRGPLETIWGRLSGPSAQAPTDTTGRSAAADRQDRP